MLYQNGDRVYANSSFCVCKSMHGSFRQYSLIPNSFWVAVLISICFHINSFIIIIIIIIYFLMLCYLVDFLALEHSWYTYDWYILWHICGGSFTFLFVKPESFCYIFSTPHIFLLEDFLVCFLLSFVSGTNSIFYLVSLVYFCFPAFLRPFNCVLSEAKTILPLCGS